MTERHFGRPQNALGEVPPQPDPQPVLQPPSCSPRLGGGGDTAEARAVIALLSDQATQLAASQEDLYRKLLKLQAEAAALPEARARIEALEAALATAERERDAMRLSTSWRITAPLRRGIARLRG